MKEKRKWLTILISICLVVTLIPSAVFADADGGTNIDNAIMLGTSGIDDGEFVYLGDYDYNGNNYNLPWLVLDSEKTNMGKDGIFTLSWYCLKEVNQQQDLSRNDLYSSSKRRTWCQEFFNGDSLSNKEKSWLSKHISQTMLIMWRRSHWQVIFGEHIVPKVKTTFLTAIRYSYSP